MEQDTDTEDTATATAGIDGCSLNAAVWKLDGEIDDVLAPFSFKILGKSEDYSEARARTRPWAWRAGDRVRYMLK